MPEMKQDARLTLEVAPADAGVQSGVVHLERSGEQPATPMPAAAYTTPGSNTGGTSGAPRAKLIQEADRAIRGDLEKFPRALQCYDLLSHDQEALANWDMANFITVRKLGYNDHGRVHAWVTAAASLAILELLLEARVRGDVIESGTGHVACFVCGAEYGFKMLCLALIDAIYDQIAIKLGFAVNDCGKIGCAIHGRAFG